jgi:influenza virus NS1A-binding protein
LTSNDNLFLSLFLLQFQELLLTTNFLQLPSIQIEVLHQTKEEMAMVAEDSLCRLVLDWTKREINDHSASVT